MEFENKKRSLEGKLETLEAEAEKKEMSIKQMKQDMRLAEDDKGRRKNIKSSSIYNKILVFLAVMLLRL